MIRRMMITTIVLFTMGGVAHAQRPPMGGPGTGRPGIGRPGMERRIDRREDRREERREVIDEMRREFFAPEAIMKFQSQIDLTSAQRNSVTDAIGETQSQILKLQWQMQSETQKLVEMVRAPRVDETATLAQVDRVLGIERDVKRQHVTLLIRIKNTLTPEQQSKLRSLREDQ